MGVLRTSRMCVVEARPCVLAIFFLRFLVGAAMAVPIVDHGRLLHSWAPALVWLLGVFAVYLFNGVMDVREDRINGSQRPIARGALPPDLAARITAVAAVLSLAGGFALGMEIGWAVTALLVLGFLYSGPPAYLKRQPPGAAVTVLALGLLTYYVGYVSYAGHGWTAGDAALPVFAGALSLWMGLVGIPSKDLSDVAGDRAAGRRSMPVVYGEPVARRVLAAAALGLAAAFCSAVAFAAPSLLWPAVIMSGGAVTIAVVTLSGLSHGSRRRRRRPYRVFMATQFFTHISMLTPINPYWV